MIIRLTLALLAAAALTIAPAMIEGKYMNRWRIPVDLTVTAQQLDSFPDAFDDWVQVADGERLVPAVVEELGLAGYITRTYQHRKTNETVHMMLMVGFPGRLLRHEPDVCYANRANRQEGEPIVTILEERPNDRFRTLRYTPPSVVSENFIVTYAMRTDDLAWNVPYWRRMELADASHLFKVQALTSAPAGNFDNAMEVNERFLSSFTKAFNNWLAATDESQRGGDVATSR